MGPALARAIAADPGFGERLEASGALLYDHLGVRLPPHVVRDRLAGARGTRRRGDRDRVDTGDVLEMLGRLRDAAGEDLRDDPWGGPGAGPRPV